MSRTSRIVVRSAGAIVLALILIAGIAAFRNRSTSAAAPTAAAAESAQPVRTVAVYRVGRRDLVRTQTLSAELHPYATTNLYAKVSGYLRSIDVDYGSRVSAGQTIATLELPEQEADLSRTRTALDLAKLDYDRLSSVNRSTPGLIAQQDVDKARAAYLSARDEHDRAQTVMNYTAIVAPFSGVVTKRYVDPGALIQAGVSSSQIMPIVQVSDTYRLRLVIETPESIVPDIHVGTPVVVHVQGVGESMNARVARYSYDVHEDTRTMHTEVDIDNPKLELKPGMYADVVIGLQRRPDVLAIPTQALSTEGGPNVWVVDRDNELIQRPVTVGLETPNWVEVRSGVHEGDNVFFGDRSALSTGTKVQPKVVASVEK